MRNARMSMQLDSGCEPPLRSGSTGYRLHLTGRPLRGLDCSNLGLSCAAMFAFALGFATPVTAAAAMPGKCGDPATPISSIQGSSESAILTGNAVVEAVVVGDFQGRDGLNGYYLQEEDSDTDGNPATSEGIFVYDPETIVDVESGNLVRVTGEVGEYNNQTQIRATGRPDVCSKRNQVSAATLEMPLASIDDLEQLEGMLVKIDRELVVIENYNLGRYGELSLAASRLFAPAQLALPGLDAVNLKAENNRSRVLLDDGSLQENPELPPFLGPGGIRRVGDTAIVSAAILGQGRSTRSNRSPLSYRLHPAGDRDAVSFVNSNPRPDVPQVGGSIRVAAFNVLNFFSTLDSGGNRCGPKKDSDCRGANSNAEFELQSAKIVAAIEQLDADVIGLSELENNRDTAIRLLVEQLNEHTGSIKYEFVATGTIGGDVIRVGLIYRPANVLPVGAPAILDQNVDRRFNSDKNRPSLAQTFESKTGGVGEKFTVVVNHLKSKGRPCDDIGDPDTGDGQGNCARTRTLATEAMIDWIASDPTGANDPDFLVIGDLNAHSREDVLERLRDAGFVDLLHRHAGGSSHFRYSTYVYRGESSTLDHALASESLASKVTGAAIWSINADEPRALDYNHEYKSDRHIVQLKGDAFRSSDHDPLVIGIEPGGR